MQSDEIKRIESIVNDITKLRNQNKECQEKLKLKTNDTKLNKKTKKLKNQIKKHKNLLKVKEKEIKTLKNQRKSNKKENLGEICKIQKFDKPNKFPKLILKDKYLKYQIIKIKASSYHLKVKAKIYNKVNGKHIETWNKGTSFTTNEKALLESKDSWFRITGFFINAKWVKSQSQMWIKTKYTKKK